MWPGNQFQVLFYFYRIFCKKESEEACMLILTYSDSFAITYSIKSTCLKNFIFQERLCCFLHKHKGPGMSFQAIFFFLFSFDSKFSFVILHKLNLNISRMKRAFEKKQKTFFLVSKVLSSRLKKENSKNISGINFKD